VSGARALFLDRDGVVVRESESFGSRALEVLPGAARAIGVARAAGFRVVVVTNQPVVARGAMTEDDVRAEHARLGGELARAGGAVDAFYFCPHHPSATLAAYRAECACRKPRPGMLVAAARDLGIDLAASVMVGDRASDVAAGRRAGCRTILVLSGSHAAAPIESPDPIDDAPPDATCADLAAAVELVLRAWGTR
jgi:D-glycero-D-manno-heptose 1,7-bisphosphate phosphatase